MDSVSPPAEFRRQARRFMYYQLFRASLPFDSFLEVDRQPGFVRLRELEWADLTPEKSATIRVIVEGITQGKSFLVEEKY